MSSASTPPADFDPYAPRLTLLERHGGRIAAAVVFVLTIVLAVVSFPPFKTSEFAYAMLVPGAFWAYTGPRLKIFAWTMLGAQAVAWTILLGWLHNVTWAGLLLLGPFVGVWVGSWYLAAWWVLPRMVGRPTLTRLAAMVGLAGVWVVIEWTRTWLLGGFPWLPLAASQWERATILQISAWTGAHGVSFVLVMMNLGFAAYAHRLFREGATGLNKRSQEFFLALFSLLVCVAVHMSEAFNRRGYSRPLGAVALVQPAIPQAVKWDPARAQGILEVLERTTLDAARGRPAPDLVVWPEAVTPIPLRGDSAMQSFVEDLVKRARVPLFTGSIAVENRDRPDEAWRNGAFVVTPEEGLAADYYAKRRLVPFGEFVPLRPVLGWLEKVVPVGGDFAPGDFAAPLRLSLRGQAVDVGPLICYEDIFPDLARASARAGAHVLVVVTNNGWFGQGGASYQHAAHAVLRAVETRRPVLRCGNSGWSGWIDEFGHVRAVVTNEQSSIYFRGARTIEVTRDARWIDRQTFYTEHGDWFVLVGAVLALIGFAALRLGN